MPIDAAKIAQMEKELAEAKAQLLQEHGKRYEILMREISEDEKGSGSLTASRTSRSASCSVSSFPTSRNGEGAGTERAGEERREIWCAPFAARVG